MTTTTALASSRPLINSLSAWPSATEVSVVAAGHSRDSTFVTKSPILSVKWEIHSMPHCSLRSNVSPAGSSSVHFSLSPHVFGPLNNCSETFTRSLPPCKFWMSFSAMILDCCQPHAPKLPLPSKRMITSTLDRHSTMLRFSGRRRAQGNSLHGWKLSRNGTLSAAGQTPVPRAGSSTSLVRRKVPESHAFEHVDHTLQSESSQSSSHDAMPQACSSSVLSHGVPLCWASTRIFLLRSITPPPHSALHEDHPLQSLKTQSTGHAAMLQLTSSFKGGHFTPIPMGCTTTLRDLIMVPPPHDTEQSSICQSVTSQSVMKVFCPSIFSNSPRIFVRAQISDRYMFWLSQHFVISVS